MTPSRTAAGRAAGLLIVLGLAGCTVERPDSGGPGRETGAAARPAAGGRDDYPNMILERNVGVPMRDGVVLRADVYRPDAPGRFPTLIMRTPYGKDGVIEDGSEPTVGRAARAGYAVVVQDVRGRYNSDGEFRPYEQEGRDGHDTIEWAAAQPWSDGRVGTFGLSYPGAAQWLAAMETPPHLVSIFPAMTFATGRHFFYFGGAFNHDWMRWIGNSIVPDVRRRRGLPGPKTETEAEQVWGRRKWEWEEFLPLREFPLFRDVAPWYYDWLAHPDDGEFWRFADVTAAHGRITVPALNFSAWYDSAYGPLGAIANFTGMRAGGATAEARRGQRLILGPWDHGDPKEHETRSGEYVFGPNGTIDYYGLVLRWHDRWLKGIRNGIDEGPPVRLFVMGDNVWRDEWEWPLKRARETVLYLRGGGYANTLRGDGLLAPEPPAPREPADRYVYDPRRPVRMVKFEQQGAFDRSPIQARRDVLVYTTEPLESDLEVTGPIVVRLWIASSAPDTDFAVMLCDVHPGGRALNVLPQESGFLRARYRESETAPKFLAPGQPTEIVIGGMVTSNVFKRGHRIRLEVTSSRFPVFDRNPNTGEPFGVSARMVPARQTILHDAAHPSRVILPVIPRP
jgi:hypothetical protein